MTSTRAAQGLGYLSSTADHNGMLRRLPLVVRYNGAFCPSLGFHVSCDISVSQPRTSWSYQDAVFPCVAHTILELPLPMTFVIPIHRHGTMVINYIGAWERFTHYPLERILVGL